MNDFSGSPSVAALFHPSYNSFFHLSLVSPNLRIIVYILFGELFPSFDRSWFCSDNSWQNYEETLLRSRKFRYKCNI